MSTRIVSQFKEAGQSAMAMLCPWGELLDLTAFSLASNLSNATTRLAQNLTRFRSYYALTSLTVLFLILIFHPFSIVVFLVVFASWLVLYFSRDRPLDVAGIVIGDLVVMGFLVEVMVVALVCTHVWLNVLISAAIGVSN